MVVGGIRRNFKKRHYLFLLHDLADSGNGHHSQEQGWQLIREQNVTPTITISNTLCIHFLISAPT